MLCQMAKNWSIGTKSSLKSILSDQHGDATEYFWIQIYLDGHMDSPMCFIMGHIFITVGQKKS